ncbi:MAG TPA: cysteine dioxygenase family protein [Candidatus Limnocylindria bacterium]|nr:cysteine dioxygenase family protein [Candidatus Limnocylindria bacterium]
MDSKMAYSLAQFVADLRSITAAAADEPEILRQVAPLAERLAGNPDLPNQAPIDLKVEKGLSFGLLHENPDHTLAVALLRWLPRGATLPHNHGTWGIVVGLEGAEKNIFWRRSDDGSRAGYAQLERVGVLDCELGRAVVLPNSIIHSVENITDEPSVSLHVYGKNVYYTNRSHFDIVNRRELPWSKNPS